MEGRKKNGKQRDATAESSRTPQGAPPAVDKVVGNIVRVNRLEEDLSCGMTTRSGTRRTTIPPRAKGLRFSAFADYLC